MFQKYLKFLKDNLKFIIAIVLLVVLVSIIYFGFEKTNKNLKIVFLDVGQGDAIFIESPDGNQIIVDGGAGNTLSRVLPKYMSFFDRSLDLLIITNPDKDHFEGFISILDNYKVPALILPTVLALDNPVYKELRNKSKEKGLIEITGQIGQKIEIGGGAYIEILFPDRNLENVSENDGSIISKLVYGNTSILLTGDTTSKIEKYLVDYGFDIDTDVLKVAHHGSKTSTSEDFVKEVSPKMAIISAGRENSYGHPHKEVLDILEKNKIPVLGTYYSGSIVLESDGENIWKSK